jgi:alpha-tubulin suppressor-like RCC1 family protein
MQEVAFVDANGAMLSLALFRSRPSPIGFLATPGIESTLLALILGPQLRSDSAIEASDAILIALRETPCYQSSRDGFAVSVRARGLLPTVRDTAVLAPIFRCAEPALGRLAATSSLRTVPLNLLPFYGVEAWVEPQPTGTPHAYFVNHGFRFVAIAKRSGPSGTPLLLNRSTSSPFAPYLLDGVTGASVGSLLTWRIGEPSTHVDPLSASDDAAGVDYCVFGMGRTIGEACPFAFDATPLRWESFTASLVHYVLLPALDVIPGLRELVTSELAATMASLDFGGCVEADLAACIDVLFSIGKTTLEATLNTPAGAAWLVQHGLTFADVSSAFAVKGVFKLSFNLTGVAFTLAAAERTQVLRSPPSQIATIEVSPGSVNFASASGGAIPASQFVSVTNRGGGTLAGLSIASVIYAANQPSGWLAAPTLSSTTAPSTLSIRPGTSNLPQGTYQAVIRVSATGNVTNSPREITVTFAVSPPQAQVPAAPSNLHVVAVSTDYVDLAWTDNSTNEDGFFVQAVEGVSGEFPESGNVISFGALTSGRYAGLLPGTVYRFRVRAFNAAGNSAPSNIVLATTTSAPTINLSASTAIFAATAGGANPPSQNNIQVTNSAIGTLSGLSVGSITYEAGQPTGWLSASLSSTTAPATVTLAVVTGALPAGSYTAFVPITSSAPFVTNSPRTITVTFTVTAAPTPTINLSASTANFAATAGGANPPSQNNIQVTNRGTGTLSGLGVGTITYQAGQPIGWLSASLSSTTAPATVTLSAVTGALTAGTYIAGVPITSSTAGVTNSPQAITVSLSVSAPPLPITPTVTAGSSHTCRLSSSGIAYCWGDNSYGQLGDGSTTTRLTPVAVAGGFAFASLVAGGDHTCAVTTTGASYCWGRNDRGQLGNGDAANGLVPQLVSSGFVFTRLSPGYRHTCGVSSTDEPYCWGDNSYGQLGDGTTTTRLLPERVGGNASFRTLVAASDHTCGLNSGGVTSCWGANQYGQLGDGTSTDRLTPVPVVGNLTFSSLSAGLGQHTCGLTSAGAAYCWGQNERGQLGDGTFIERWTPVAVGGGPYTSLSLGGDNTCGIAAGGAAFCWGDNNYWQLGIGSVWPPASNPTPGPVSGGLSFARISLNYHACGVTTTGATYCWGANHHGELGDGTTTIRSIPTLVITP